jgi:hypothetical protein
MPITKHVTGQKKPTKIKGSIRVNLGACAKFFTLNGTEGTFLVRLKISGDSNLRHISLSLRTPIPWHRPHPGTQKKKRFGTCL